jgi:rhodanese-related sulfurtransferase
MIEDLSQEDWAEQLASDDNAVILDVRTDAEVSEGIIPNAKHIDFYKGQDFITEIEALDKSKNYYLYCRSGNRSGQACQIMEQLGFENAYNLEGGMLQWAGDVIDKE